MSLLRYDLSNAGHALRRLWQTLAPLPGGRRLFDAILAAINPYTGTIGARCLSLAPGRARVQLRERWRVRNHVGSIHAVALTNLAELTAGLALLFRLPVDARAIPIRLTIDFHRKARGVVTASASCELPRGFTGERDIGCAIHDASGALVASASARWTIGQT